MSKAVPKLAIRNLVATINKVWHRSSDLENELYSINRLAAGLYAIGLHLCSETMREHEGGAIVQLAEEIERHTEIAEKARVQVLSLLDPYKPTPPADDEEEA